MTLLNRYILRRLTTTLCGVLFSLIALFILVDLLTHRQSDFIDNEVPLNIIGLYYVSLLPTILFEYNFLAMSVLLTVLTVFGRMTEFNETTAFLASGVSLHRICAPPIALALLLSALSFGLGETLGVRGNVAVNRIEDTYLSSAKPNDRAGVSWMDLEQGWICHLTKYNRIAATGEGVVMHRLQENQFDEIRAGRIFWDDEALVWYLEDGHWFTTDTEQDMPLGSKSFSQIRAPFEEEPSVLFALDQPAQLKPAWVLAKDLRAAQGRGVSVGSRWVDYHTKFARPALCIVIVFLAIPFAVRIRRGGLGAGLGLSVIIGLSYMLLFMASVGMGHMNILSPITAAWLANALFAGVGVSLFWRMPS